MSQQEPNKSTEKSSSNFKAFFKGHLGKVIGGAIALVLFLIITNPSLIPFLSANTKASLKNIGSKLVGDVSKISGVLKINLVTLFQVIAIILMLFIITNLILFILNKLKPKKPKVKSAVSLAKSAISYIMTIIGIFWCLSALGVNLSTIFASVGILALIIGFGAQSLVEDLVTGIFLVFEDQFNVGDIIEVNGFRGTVESIGIRTTAIRDAGQNVKIINNSDLRNILNRSSADSVAATTVSISYASDLDEVEPVIRAFLPKIREKHPDVFLSDPRYLGVQELADSGVVLKFVASDREKDIFSAPRIMNREIKVAFDKAGIEIPFNQVVVHEAKE